MQIKDKEYANHMRTLKKACLEWGKQKAKMNQRFV